MLLSISGTSMGLSPVELTNGLLTLSAKIGLSRQPLRFSDTGRSTEAPDDLIRYGQSPVR